MTQFIILDIATFGDGQQTRKSARHVFIENPQLRLLFINLLIRAQAKSQIIDKHQHPLNTPRGSLFATVQDLAAELRSTKKRVYRLLHKLDEEGYITIKKYNRLFNAVKIQITDFDRYCIDINEIAHVRARSPKIRRLFLQDGAP